MHVPIRSAARIGRLLTIGLLLAACSAPAGAGSNAPAGAGSNAPAPSSSATPSVTASLTGVLPATTEPAASVLSSSAPSTSAQPVASSPAMASVPPAATARPTPTRQPTPRPTPAPTARATSTPAVVVPSTGGPWVIGTATRGPICPVERFPPDPLCAPKPVAGAVIVVRDSGGLELARTTTASDGTYRVAVRAGPVQVEGEPAAGVMHAPAPIDVVVPAGAAAWVRVDLSYDTGIR